MPQASQTLRQRCCGSSEVLPKRLETRIARDCAVVLLCDPLRWRFQCSARAGRAPFGTDAPSTSSIGAAAALVRVPPLPRWASASHAFEQ
jgi:hypothetical protein